MGQVVKRASNYIEVKTKRQQEQAVLDAQELAIENDEQTLDLTELVMCLSEENEELKKRVEELEMGGKE